MLMIELPHQQGIPRVKDLLETLQIHPTTIKFNLFILCWTDLYAGLI
jgi:hypothetical protein